MWYVISVRFYIMGVSDYIKSAVVTGGPHVTAARYAAKHWAITIVILIGLIALSAAGSSAMGPGTSKWILGVLSVMFGCALVLFAVWRTPSLVGLPSPWNWTVDLTLITGDVSALIT